MAATNQILQPLAIYDRISQLKVVNTSLQNEFGFNRGGAAVRPALYGRSGQIDIFNETRRVAGATLPGAASSAINRQQVGKFDFTIPRSAEHVPMLYEELTNMRRVGGPVGEIDDRGLQMIFDQEKVLAQSVTNLREFQTAAMLRGSYSFGYSGDRLVNSFSGGAYTVDYQVPSGNKSTLNMLGAGPIIDAVWSSASTKIISHLYAINAAFLQLTGRPLAKVRCSSIVWGYVSSNTQVQNAAGSVNRYFEVLDRDIATTNFRAILHGIPWVEWSINDNVLDPSGTGTNVKLFEDDHASFTIATTPAEDTFRYWEYAATIVEQEGMPPTKRQGEYYWVKYLSDPYRLQLHQEFNGLPVPMIPKGLAYGAVA